MNGEISDADTIGDVGLAEERRRNETIETMARMFNDFALRNQVEDWMSSCNYRDVSISNSRCWLCNNARFGVVYIKMMPGTRARQSCDR